MDKLHFFNLIKESPDENLETMSNRTRYYMGFFDKKGRRFNWCAGLWGFYWFLFRRMPLLSIVGSFMFIMFDVFMWMIGVGSDKAMLFYMVISFFVIGYFGSSLYLRHLEALKKDIAYYGTNKILTIVFYVYAWSVPEILNYILHNDDMFTRLYKSFYNIPYENVVFKHPISLEIVLALPILIYGLYMHRQENRLSIKDYYLYVLFNIKP